jgi:hypothetical protein
LAVHDRNRIRTLRKILRKLGINPLPNRKQTKYAVKFSRGNDLAFLWFLFEMVYCTDDDFDKIRDYSANERLLLTTISHLDMTATLRRLHQVLPRKGDPVDPKCPKKRVKHPPKVRLSQFHYLNQPTPLFPKPRFAIYKGYNNPRFVIPNETNRWFANGDLKTRAEVKMAERIIKDAIKNGLPGSNELTESQALCLKHKSMKEDILPRIMKFDKYEGNFDRANPDQLHCEGVLYGMEVELGQANDRARESEKHFEARKVIRMLLRQMLEGTMDRNHIIRCSDCLEATKRQLSIGDNAGCPGRTMPSQADEQKEPVEQKPCYLDPPVEKRDVNGEFFVSSPDTCEFRFRYDKIFQDYCKSPDPVKKCIDAALNVDQYYSEDAAISKCLEAMWKSELGMWEEQDRIDTFLNENFVIIQSKEDYDSPDKCFELLRRGVQVLKRNPKFVLASFPDTETLPVLREWVLNRFGFRYTLNDIRRKEIVQKLHMNEVILCGAVPLEETLKKSPYYKNFGMKKSQKTVGKFLKMMTLVAIEILQLSCK